MDKFTDRLRNHPGEKGHALILADKVLDRPSADPDDDLAVLARQFLRMRERECESAQIIDEMQAALTKLRLTAALLHQNSVGCAVNHYGHDHESLGLPGWLADAQKDIEAALDVLTKFDGRA